MRLAERLAARRQIQFPAPPPAVLLLAGNVFFLLSVLYHGLRRLRPRY